MVKTVNKSIYPLVVLNAWWYGPITNFSFFQAELGYTIYISVISTNVALNVGSRSHIWDVTGGAGRYGYKYHNSFRYCGSIVGVTIGAFNKILT